MTRAHKQSNRRTLGIPDGNTPEWRLPAVLYWLLRRRSILLADQGEIYANEYAWKRRLLSIDRQIEEAERELLKVDQAPPFAWVTPERSIAPAGADNDQYSDAA